MNNFKKTTYFFIISLSIIFSTGLFADEPQLFMFNQKVEKVVSEKNENLEKFEIKNKELIELGSFQTKKKTIKMLAGQKIFFPPKNS